MPNIFNNSKREIGFGRLVSLRPGEATEVSKEALDYIQGSKIGKAFFASKELTLGDGPSTVAEDVSAAPGSREDFIRSLFTRDDMEKTAEGRPTLPWINKQLTGNMKPVTAEELGKLWGK